MEKHPVVYWLWLEMIFGVANPKLHEILTMVDSPRELYYALHDPDCGLLSDRERQRLRSTSLEQAENVLTYCEKNGIGIMTWEDEIYPDSLRHIYNPPCVLFYRGDPSLLHRGTLLTVVGTRRPSDYSRKVADWLCTDLARCNIILCSGCAVGLDAAAHWAAIRQETPTIGVMGCGVDYDYPKENREMKERIVRNGLLISEYFPGTQPIGAHFPVRNRILAGISEATLVLEAGQRSGYLITARLACEQGKSVLCVPPADLFDPRYSGVAGYLRDGAYPVFNHLDVLYVFYMKYPHTLLNYDDTDASRTLDSLVFAEEPVQKRPKKAKASEKKEAPAEPEPYTIPAEANDAQRRVLEFLKDGGQTINAICMMLGMDFAETSVLMMDLDLAGWVVNTERDTYTLPDGK